MSHKFKLFEATNDKTARDEDWLFVHNGEEWRDFHILRLLFSDFFFLLVLMPFRWCRHHFQCDWSISQCDCLSVTISAWTDMRNEWNCNKTNKKTERVKTTTMMRKHPLINRQKTIKKKQKENKITDDWGFFYSPFSLRLSFVPWRVSLKLLGKRMEYDENRIVRVRKIKYFFVKKCTILLQFHQRFHVRAMIVSAGRTETE